MTVRMIARPIDEWPGQLRDSDARTSSPFEASWTTTTVLLRREVGMLAPDDGDIDLVLQLAIKESQCRNDGWIKENARPTHPGVILAFESRHGALQYSTDKFTGPTYYQSNSSPGWQANVRAIALGLEALRRIDRYGISHSGEQYRGWQALNPGTPAPPAPMTIEEAAEFLAAHGHWGGRPGKPSDLLTNPEVVEIYFREAAKRLHPDRGGDPAMFHRASEARQLLEAAQ